MYSANERVLEWSISSLPALPSLFPSFLLSPSTSAAFGASSNGLEVEGRERMFDPGAWGRPRSVGLQLPPRVRVKRVVYAHARALGQRNVNGNGAFVRCPRPRMRQQRCCFGAAKMGQGDGRTDRAEGRSVPGSDALGERRVGDRERDLVAQGERGRTTR